MSENDEIKQLKILNKIIKESFDGILKHIQKTDKNYNNIINICNKLKDLKYNLNDINSIHNLCILLLSPCEKYNIKIIEIILKFLEEILTKNLINNNNILQILSEKFIKIIKIYFQLKEININIELKTISLLKIFYFNPNIFLHNENLNYLIKLNIRIFLISKSNKNYLDIIFNNLKQIIDYILKDFNNCDSNILNEYVNNIYNNNNNFIVENEKENDKKNIYKKIEYNQYNFLVKNYVDYLIDIIEIQEEFNNNSELQNNLKNIYKNQLNEIEKNNLKIDKKEKKENKNSKIIIIENEEENNENNKINEENNNFQIQNNNITINNILIQNFSTILYSQNFSNLKNKIEKLNLSKLNLFSSKEKISNFGWCIFCHKSANFYSNLLNFPICSKECENNFSILISNIIKRSDYLNLLIFFSIKSNKISNQNESNINLRCRELCLDIIKEMIDKGGKYFKNDKDFNFILLEFSKDSLLKNTLSNEISIFKSTLKLFLSLLNSFRQNLKELIIIFFIKILITILESENYDYFFKEAILDFLIKLSDNSYFLVEIYVNYDCDINYNPVYSELLKVLTKIINGYYKSPKFKNFLNQIEIDLLFEKTFEIFYNFIKNLNNLVEENDKIKKYKIQLNEIEENNNINNNNLNNNNEENIENNNIINSIESKTEIKTKITKNLEIKKLLEKSIQIFNISSYKDCLKYLQSTNMIYSQEKFTTIKNLYISNLNSTNKENEDSILLFKTLFSETEYEQKDIKTQKNFLKNLKNFNIYETPFISPHSYSLLYLLEQTPQSKLIDISYEDYNAFEMSRFIRSNYKNLNKEKIGDFLCSSKPLQKKSMIYYINSFNFKNMHILNALKLLFQEFPLIGEGQIIDRIVQIFGQKYYNENNNILKNPDSAYYLAFSIIMLNTDLHRDEITQKISMDEYINRFMYMCPNDDYINNHKDYLSNIYKKILKDPIVIPGQKINLYGKHKDILVKEEQNDIYNETFSRIKNLDKNNKFNEKKYIIDIDNDNIRQLIEISWSNFLFIFSQFLNNDNNNNYNNNNENNKNINYNKKSIESLLTMAKICGILNLNTCTEAFINCLINYTNLNENKEIFQNNIECIKNLIEFSIENGNLLKNSWRNLLNLISKIDYYLFTEDEIIKEDIKNKNKNKINNINLEKEYLISLKKKEIINNNINDLFINNIFSKTENFDEKSIIYFIESLCKISEEELNSYYQPRLFSLQKLSEVADFNMNRIQIEWTKIWKIIESYLVNVITNEKFERIWDFTLESLRQIICKLLEKRDLSLYNFQMEFFHPLQVIFNKTVNLNNNNNKINQIENLLNIISFIVENYENNIHSGWIVIFNIIKNCLYLINNKNLNEIIKNILEKLSEELNIFKNEINNDILKSYVECFCYLFFDKNLIVFSKYQIQNFVIKIFKIIENNNNNNNLIVNIENKNKKIEFMKNFLFYLDELIVINMNEYENLIWDLFEINFDLIFNENNMEFFIFYFYIIQHLLILIFYNCNENNNILKDFDNFEKNSLLNNLNNFNKNNNENIQFIYIKKILNEILNENNIEENVNNFYINNNNNEYNENKKIIMNDLKYIINEYKKENNLLKNKIEIFNKIKENDIINIIKNFFDKSFNFIKILNNNKKNKLNYNYFFEILLQILFNYSIFVISFSKNENNNNIEIIFEILIKYLKINFSDKNKFQQNLILFSNIKSTINENNLKNLSKYFYFYSNFLLNFIEKNNNNNNLIDFYNLFTKIFLNFLKINFQSNFNLIFNNNFIIKFFNNIINIREFILKEKNKNFNFNNFEDEIELLNYLEKFFSKNKIIYNNNINDFCIVIKNEIDKIIPFYLKIFKVEELKKLFFILLSFTDSNNNDLKISVSILLKKFVELKLFVFHSKNENNCINNQNNDNNDDNNNINSNINNN